MHLLDNNDQEDKEILILHLEDFLPGHQFCTKIPQHSLLWGQQVQRIHSIFLVGSFDILRQLSVFALGQTFLLGSCTECSCLSLVGSKSLVGRGKG